MAEKLVSQYKGHQLKWVNVYSLNFYSHSFHSIQKGVCFPFQHTGVRSPRKLWRQFNKKQKKHQAARWLLDVNWLTTCQNPHLKTWKWNVKCLLGSYQQIITLKMVVKIMWFRLSIQKRYLNLSYTDDKYGEICPWKYESNNIHCIRWVGCE